MDDVVLEEIDRVNQAEPPAAIGVKVDFQPWAVYGLDEVFQDLGALPAGLHSHARSNFNSVLGDLTQRLGHEFPARVLWILRYGACVTGDDGCAQVSAQFQRLLGALHSGLQSLGIAECWHVRAEGRDRQPKAFHSPHDIGSGLRGGEVVCVENAAHNPGLNAFNADVGCDLEAFLQRSHICCTSKGP